MSDPKNTPDTPDTPDTPPVEVPVKKSKTFLEHVKSTLQCPFLQGAVLATLVSSFVYYRYKKN